MTAGRVAWIIWCLFWSACFALAAWSTAATRPGQSAFLVLAAGGSVVAILIPEGRRNR